MKYLKLITLIFSIAVYTSCGDSVVDKIQDTYIGEIVNLPPEISGIESDLGGFPIEPSMHLILTVTASDPEGGPVSYYFSSESGSFNYHVETDTGCTVDFFAASEIVAEQEVRVTVRATDSEGQEVIQDYLVGLGLAAPELVSFGITSDTVINIGQDQFLNAGEPAVFVFQANSSGSYQVQIFNDSTTAAPSFDVTMPSMPFTVGTEVTINIFDPMHAGNDPKLFSEGVTLGSDPDPDIVYIIIKGDTGESSTSVVLSYDGTAPVSTITGSVPDPDSLEPVPGIDTLRAGGLIRVLDTVTISVSDNVGLGRFMYVVNTTDDTILDPLTDPAAVTVDDTDASFPDVNINNFVSGLNIISYRAIDNAGNVEELKTISYELNNEDPIITAATATVYLSGTGLPSAVDTYDLVWYVDREIAEYAIYTDNISVPIIETGNVPSENGDTVTTVINASDLIAGEMSYDIIISAIGINGAETILDTNVTVIRDDSPPDVDINWPVAGPFGGPAYDDPSETISIIVDASDPSSGVYDAASVLELEGFPSLNPSSISGSQFTYTVQPSQYPDQTVNINAYAIDNAGNEVRVGGDFTTDFTAPDPDTIVVDSVTPAILNGSFTNINELTFSIDASSDVVYYQYQVDGGNWSVVEPVSTVDQTVTLTSDGTGVDDGNHSFSVRACDVHSNCQATADDQFTWNLDTVAPTVTIDDPTHLDFITGSTNILYTVEDSDSLIDEINLVINTNDNFDSNGKDLGDYGGTFTLDTTTDVTYSISLYATDNVGNPSTPVTPGSQIIVTSDNTPPGVSFITPTSPVGGPAYDHFSETFNIVIDSSDDGGSGISSNVSLELVGEETITSYSISGTEYTFEVSPSSYTLPGTSRTLTLLAHVTDIVGNAPDPVVSRNFEIDFEPPDANAVTIATNDLTDDEYTAQNDITFELDYSEDVVSYKYRLDSGTWNTVSGLPSGPVTDYPLDVTVSGDGPHTLDISACDLVDNCRDTGYSSFSWTLDQTGPSVTINDPVPRSGTFIGDSTNVTFSVSDNLSKIEEIHFTINDVYVIDGAPKTGVDVTDYNNISDPHILGTSGNQTYTIKLHAIDNVGNISAYEEKIFISDNTPPDVTITAPTDGYIAGGPSYDEPGELLDIEITVDDQSRSGVTDANVVVQMVKTLPNPDATTTLTPVSIVGGTYTYRIQPSDYADDDYSMTINAIATDNVGNTSPVVSSSFTIDLVPPSDTPDSITNIAVTGGVVDDGGDTNDSSLTFEVTGTTDVAYYQYNLDSAGWNSEIDINTDQPVNLNTGGSDDGIHTFAVRACDEQHNCQDTTDDTFSWTLDTVAPSVTINSITPHYNNIYINGQTSIDFTISDNLTLVDDVHLIINGDDTLFNNLNDDIFQSGDSGNPHSLDTEATGDQLYTIELYAFDNVGNESTHISRTRTSDNTPPTVTIIDEVDFSDDIYLTGNNTRIDVEIIDTGSGLPTFTESNFFMNVGTGRDAFDITVDNNIYTSIFSDLEDYAGESDTGFLQVLNIQDNLGNTVSPDTVHSVLACETWSYNFFGNRNIKSILQDSVTNEYNFVVAGETNSNNIFLSQYNRVSGPSGGASWEITQDDCSTAYTEPGCVNSIIYISGFDNSIIAVGEKGDRGWIAEIDNSNGCMSDEYTFSAGPLGEMHAVYRKGDDSNYILGGSREISSNYRMWVAKLNIDLTTPIQNSDTGFYNGHIYAVTECSIDLGSFNGYLIAGQKNDATSDNGAWAAIINENLEIVGERTFKSTGAALSIIKINDTRFVVAGTTGTATSGDGWISEIELFSGSPYTLNDVSPDVFPDDYINCPIKSIKELNDTTRYLVSGAKYNDTDATWDAWITTIYNQNGTGYNSGDIAWERSYPYLNDSVDAITETVDDGYRGLFMGINSRLYKLTPDGD